MMKARVQRWKSPRYDLHLACIDTWSFHLWSFDPVGPPLGEVGTVQLISVEKVPSYCGVVVDAMVEGCQGTVIVEPSQSDCAE